MSIVSKPDHGAVIGTSENNEVKATEPFQVYLDDLQQKINELEARIETLETAP